MKKIQEHTKVILLLAAILICASVVFSDVRGPLEKALPRSFLTPVFTYLEQERPNDPEVVILGSSRIHSCINRYLFSKLSGIEPSKILLLQVDGAGTWEELSICRRFPWLLDSAPLVIVEVEPWMFNKYYFSQNGNLFLQPGLFQWATLQDRLEFPDLKTKALLTLDYLWPVSERRSLQSWCDVIAKVAHKEYAEPFNPDSTPQYHYDEAAYRKVAENPEGTAQFQAHAALNDFTFADYKAEYLARLVRLAEKKSKRIILLQPPLKNEYIDIMYGNPRYLKGQMQVKNFLYSLENENVRTVLWEGPADCGLDDSVFVDYGHFNAKGASAFTQKLFNELKQMRIIE